MSVVFCAALMSTLAAAQEARVQVDRGPHYVGDPVTVQVVASQFEDDPAPVVTVGDIVGASLRFAGVSDSSSTSISFVNGRMSRTKEVRFVYRYELVAVAPGRVRIPPFVVAQGTTTRRTRPVELTIQGVPTTGLVDIAVNLPTGPLFVGQKVPIEVVLKIDREAERDLLALSVSVPLFDLPSLRFLDDPSASRDNALEIQTAAGVLRLPAITTEERVNGRVILVVRAARTMIALSPERIRAAPPRAVISRGTRFRRDLFNQRQATGMERLMAEGPAISVEVVEIPKRGRPSSFAGAVGSGFSLEVSADRSVVQLGEPIVLSFLLRGDGDLSTAGLPRFDADGLFDKEQFRLPEEPPPGLVSEDGKRFEASLRVIDAEVREVPAIAYSWFDAKTRRFETTYSRPIALSVGAAQIIGADDVDRREAESNPAQLAEVEAANADRPGTSRKNDRKTRSTSLAASGANLAVDEDLARVLGASPARRASPLVIPVVYAFASCVLAFAFFDHRRRARDPRELAKSAAFEAATRGLDAAVAEGGTSGASTLGRTLRELVATEPSEATPEIDALVAECDALRFAPAGSGADLPSDLVVRARQLLSDQRGRA